MNFIMANLAVYDVRRNFLLIYGYLHIMMNTDRM